VSKRRTAGDSRVDDDLATLPAARQEGHGRTKRSLDFTRESPLVPAHRRAAVSRQAGRISPVVVMGGVVSGTWELDGDQVRASCFGEAGPVPRAALEGEVDRWSRIVGRELRLSLSSA
jgi:hypothetical protein